MPDTKVTALAAYATVHTDDLLSVVDVHDTTMAASGTDKRCAVSVLDTRYMSIWASLSGTAGRIPYQSAGGALVDGAGLTFNGSNILLTGTNPGVQCNIGQTLFVGSNRGTVVIGGGGDTTLTMVKYTATSGGVVKFVLDCATATTPLIASDMQYSFYSGTNIGGGSAGDAGLARSAAGAVKATNGLTGYGSLASGVSDAGTATTPAGLTVGHNTSGTAAAGFGSGVTFLAQSSTTADRNVGKILAPWAVATDASRTGGLALYACDSTGTDRLGVQISSDGTRALLGFYGATPVAKAAAPTVLADVITILRNLGLCT